MTTKKTPEEVFNLMLPGNFGLQNHLRAGLVTLLKKRQNCEAPEIKMLGISREDDRLEILGYMEDGRHIAEPVYFLMALGCRAGLLQLAEAGMRLNETYVSLPLQRSDTNASWADLLREIEEASKDLEDTLGL